MFWTNSPILIEARKRKEHEEKIKNKYKPKELPMTNKDTTTKKSKPIGRPKKHEITQSKTFRLPLYLIEQIENDRMDKESLTDALIRLVKLGLLV